jgi:DNA-binding HxlR family transcriptional regulator
MRTFQDYSEIACPFHGLLCLLSGSWTSYILWLLQDRGTLRFGELKKSLRGISAKVLTERLRKLEEAGLVNRDHRPTIPPQVSYSLTPRGQALQGPLLQLRELATEWNCPSA